LKIGKENIFGQVYAHQIIQQKSDFVMGPSFCPTGERPVTNKESCERRIRVRTQIPVRETKEQSDYQVARSQKRRPCERVGSRKMNQVRVQILLYRCNSETTKVWPIRRSGKGRGSQGGAVGLF